MRPQLLRAAEGGEHRDGDGAARRPLQAGACPDGREAVLEKVPAFAGSVSPLDNNATLANAGVACVMLKDWSRRGKGEDLRSIYFRLAHLMEEIEEMTSIILVPPPIQGIGTASGFTIMVQLRDGVVDWPRREALSHGLVTRAATQSGIARAMSSFRASTPQLEGAVNRTKAEELQVTVGQVFETIAAYLGSTYVGQINRFGRVLQIYVEADSAARTPPDDIRRL